jgi:hypothetical protein
MSASGSETPAPATVAAYVRLVADLCDLRDWDIFVYVGNVGDDLLATCEAVYGQRRAKINLASNWQSMDADDFRATVVHELVHCHFAALDHTVSEMTSAAFPRRFGKLFEAAYTVQVEYTVDALSLVLSKLLPLPEFGEV